MIRKIHMSKMENCIYARHWPLMQSANMDWKVHISNLIREWFTFWRIIINCVFLNAFVAMWCLFFFSVVQMINGLDVSVMVLKPISSIRFEVLVSEHQIHFHLNMDEWKWLLSYLLVIGYGPVIRWFQNWIFAVFFPVEFFCCWQMYSFV